MTLVFHKRVNSIKADESSPLFPVCYFKLQMVTWHFCFSQGSKFNKADKSSPLVSMKCLNKQNEILLFLVINVTQHFRFFDMGVNSIRPDKFNYHPLVPRGLNEKEANISEQLLCVCSSNLIFLIYGYLMTFDLVWDLFLLVKKDETCSNLLWRLRGTKLQ